MGLSRAGFSDSTLMLFAAAAALNGYR